MPQGAQMSLYTESRLPGSRDQRVDFLTERLDTYLLSQGQQRRPNVSGPLSPPKAPVVIRQVVLDVTPEPKASKPIPGIKQLIPVSTSLFLDILAKTPVPRPTGRSTTGAPDRNKPLTWEGSGVRVCGGKIAVIHNGKVIDR